MNTEFTDQLHEAMIRLPAPVPPDLVRNVRRRCRRRRALGWGAAASATAAVAGLVVALAVPAAPVARTTAPSDHETAYVVSRLTGALGALSPSTILFEKTTPLHPSSDSSISYSWSTPSRTRAQTYSPAGRLTGDESLDYTATTLTHLVVDYPSRTWARIHAVLPSESASPSPPVPSCALGEPRGWSPDPRQEVAVLREGVSCGWLTTARGGIVDGVSTIKLSERPGATTLTFWVDATTYLPVRIDQTWAGDLSSADTQMDLQWLRATPANEAKLTVPIPAGFKQVPWK